METAESTHPLVIFGEHDDRTVAQMQRCMDYGSAVQGVLCADGHLGYAQPVGGVIAYEGHVSISGVGFDIGSWVGLGVAEPRLPLASGLGHGQQPTYGVRHSRGGSSGCRSDPCGRVSRDGRRPGWRGRPRHPIARGDAEVEADVGHHCQVGMR